MRHDQTPMVADKTLQERIEYRLEADDMVGHYDLKVKVDAGKVRLSGDVRTPSQRIEAERLAKIDGVSAITNDIKVNADADKSFADRTKKGFNKAGVAITDAWIDTKIHWFFVGEDLLKDSNIKVGTARGVVTLSGTVKSAEGKRQATRLAERTDGVKRVVDHMMVK